MECNENFLEILEEKQVETQLIRNLITMLHASMSLFLLSPNFQTFQDSVLHQLGRVPEAFDPQY